MQDATLTTFLCFAAKLQDEVANRFIDRSSRVRTSLCNPAQKSPFLTFVSKLAFPNLPPPLQTLRCSSLLATTCTSTSMTWRAELWSTDSQVCFVPSPAWKLQEYSGAETRFEKCQVYPISIMARLPFGHVFQMPPHNIVVRHVL